MMKSIRTSILLTACLAMLLTSFSGCATSGHGAGTSKSNQRTMTLDPTIENMQNLRSGAPIAVDLFSGERIEGTFSSYSAEEQILSLRVSRKGESTAVQFSGVDEVVRIQTKTINLIYTVDISSNSKKAALVLIPVIIVAGFIAYLSNAYRNTYN